MWDKTPKHDKFSLRDETRIPSGQDSSILSGSQSQREIRLILPAHGVCHIISSKNIRRGPVIPYPFNSEHSYPLSLKVSTALYLKVSLVSFHQIEK